MTIAPRIRHPYWTEDEDATLTAAWPDLLCRLGTRKAFDEAGRLLGRPRMGVEARLVHLGAPTGVWRVLFDLPIGEVRSVRVAANSRVDAIEGARRKLSIPDDRPPRYTHRLAWAGGDEPGWRLPDE